MKYTYYIVQSNYNTFIIFYSNPYVMNFPFNKISQILDFLFIKFIEYFT